MLSRGYRGRAIFHDKKDGQASLFCGVWSGCVYFHAGKYDQVEVCRSGHCEGGVDAEFVGGESLDDGYDGAADDHHDE